MGTFVQVKVPTMQFQYYLMRLKIKALHAQVQVIMHKVWLTLLKIKFKSRYFHAGNYTTSKINQAIFGSDNVEVVLTGDTFDHCLEEALTYTKEHEMNFIDPFNNVYNFWPRYTCERNH